MRLYRIKRCVSPEAYTPDANLTVYASSFWGISFRYFFHQPPLHIDYLVTWRILQLKQI
jgi:hypothetical protein